MKKPHPLRRILALVSVTGLIAAIVAYVMIRSTGSPHVSPGHPSRPRPQAAYEPRKPLDLGGFFVINATLEPWGTDATLQQVADSWRRVGYRQIERVDRSLTDPNGKGDRITLLLMKVMCLSYEGEAEKAYDLLKQVRSEVESREESAREMLATVLFFQGVTALRVGENENCIMCRGESSCILPIARAAVHTNPRGSRLAIGHFTEYLTRFPDDLEARWLLNLAHMTLGEHPKQVDPRYLISLDRFRNSEFDIGRFRDIGHVAMVNRFNQAGGAVMDDFDGDGRLDIAMTSWDPTERMALFRNQGDGTFKDRAEQAGLTGQLGGLYCVQGDYNNDGRLDLFIVRGAWVSLPVRPSLLRNNGDGTFTDVTKEARVQEPVNSNSASWADYDNDGFLDLFVCCEQQPNLLYHNRGDGTFEEVAVRAGLLAGGITFCKGSAWLDYDNDDDPDLFLNNLSGTGQLFRNDGSGAFSEVTLPMGIDGPTLGFSCWAWDYDNDGWLDLFATSYDRTLGDVVKGLLGQPHGYHSNKLFRNLEGRGFEDATKSAGLDMAFATMGSNYADFDNDGFLDMYLGTGDPNLSTLVPNRMFKNVAGQRFAEITGSSGTGHLQKGHSVACGDWDRDGDVDLFIEMGGATNGDKYHDILFENPGQGNRWLTVKLVGKTTNRAAIGARIKVVTADDPSLTVHRHVSSGSSFGANPLEQTIGLAKADRVALLEVYWPTSKTRQVFRDLAANQSIEVTEFAESYRTLDAKPIRKPDAIRH